MTPQDKNIAERSKPIARKYETGKIGFYDALKEAYIAGATDERAELLKTHEWIPISQKRPNERHWCLVFANSELFLAQYKHGIFETEIPTILLNVTHWQPLPTPPTI